MLTALLATKLYAVLLKKNVKIKMPSTVPSFVSRQFEALIPATVIVVLFLFIRLVFAATPFGTVTNFIVTMIQMPLTDIGTTLIGTLFITILNSILWFFGIHGTAVIDSFMGPLWYAARFANFDMFQASVTAARQYIVTQDFANHIIFLGGTGNTVSLAAIFACTRDHPPAPQASAAARARQSARSRCSRQRSGSPTPGGQYWRGRARSRSSRYWP